MKHILKILSSIFNESDWEIKKPQSGLTKETYIVISAKRKLFIKFDSNNIALPYLSSIGLAPKIIKTGYDGERHYIIQEYLEGNSPDRKWFNKNISELATFIKKYQFDKKLANILGECISYEDHIDLLLRQIEKDLLNVNCDCFKTELFLKTYHNFIQQSKGLMPLDLTPIHGDPNYSNCIITSTGLIMLDWDNIQMSDPYNDLGPILWWYLPETTWSNFFKDYPIEYDRKKVFWWSAKRSLSVALWFDNKKDEMSATDFVSDFIAAVYTKNNPKFNN